MTGSPATAHRLPPHEAVVHDQLARAVVRDSAARAADARRGDLDVARRGRAGGRQRVLEGRRAGLDAMLASNPGHGLELLAQVLGLHGVEVFSHGPGKHRVHARHRERAGLSHRHVEHGNRVLVVCEAGAEAAGAGAQALAGKRADLDLVGAHADNHLGLGHRRVGQVLVAGRVLGATDRDLAVAVGLTRDPVHGIERHRRQRHQREPVGLEQLRPAQPLLVVALLRALVALREQALVEGLGRALLGHRHKEVSADPAHFALHAALLVAGVRVGKGGLEAVVHAKRLEQVGLLDLAADAAADLGGVVEDHQWRDAADVLEGVLQALAHAHGLLVAEQLGEAVVGLRERLGEVAHAGEVPAVVEVGLPEVDLYGAGRPLQVQKRPLRRLEPRLGPSSFT